MLDRTGFQSFSRFRSIRRATDWTDERIARLKQLYADGESYSVIADDLGVTRNAVSGKVDRLGLDPRPDRRRRFSQIGRTKPRKVSFRVRALKARANDPGIETATVSDAPAKFLGLTILEIEDGKCRYPHGDGPFLFCAQPVQEGSAYCAGCHPLCYQKPTPPGDRHLQLRKMGREYQAALRSAPP